RKRTGALKLLDERPPLVRRVNQPVVVLDFGQSFGRKPFFGLGLGRQGKFFWRRGIARLSRLRCSREVAASGIELRSEKPFADGVKLEFHTKGLNRFLVHL